MKKIHFFDVDNTVIAGATAVQYLILGILKGIFPLRPLFSLPALMLKYKTGEFSVDKFYYDGIPFLKGISRSTLDKLAVQTFDKRLKKRIFQDAYALIKNLRQQGETVVLATSSIDIVIAPLADFLGIKDFIASSLFFDKTACTGKFDGALAFGAEKLRRVMEYTRVNDISPDKCYFYSDSIHDLPLLLEVGHPVAVNPDKLLYAEAVKRGWQIFSFSGKG